MASALRKGGKPKILKLGFNQKKKNKRKGVHLLWAKEWCEKKNKGERGGKKARRERALTSQKQVPPPGRRIIF